MKRIIVSYHAEVRRCHYFTRSTSGQTDFGRTKPHFMLLILHKMNIIICIAIIVIQQTNSSDVHSYTLLYKIIALSETAINSSHTSYTILSYNCEMNYRSKRKGGGVSLYIHSTLQYKLRNELQLGGEVNSVFVELFKHTTNTKYNVICGCVYRPPSMSLREFNKLLSNTFDKIQHEKKYVYITGDFYVNTMPHLKGGLSIQEFKNIFSSNFCFPSINKPTRVTNHSASLIDNIYSNVPIQGSDYHLL